MTNDTSDTKFSEFTEQSAEPLTVAEPSVQTLISPAHDSHMNTLQSEENLQIETSSPRAHGNNEELSHDLHTVRNFIHKIITLLQEFLTSLNEKGDTNTSPHITEQKINRRPTHSNSKETSNHHLLHDIHTAIETIAKQHQFQKHDKTSQNYHLRLRSTVPCCCALRKLVNIKMAGIMVDTTISCLTTCWLQKAQAKPEHALAA